MYHRIKWRCLAESDTGEKKQIHTGKVFQSNHRLRVVTFSTLHKHECKHSPPFWRNFLQTENGFPVNGVPGCGALNEWKAKNISVTWKIKLKAITTHMKSTLDTKHSFTKPLHKTVYIGMKNDYCLVCHITCCIRTWPEFLILNNSHNLLR